MAKAITLFVVCFFFLRSISQSRYFTKNARIEIVAPSDNDVKAVNRNGKCVLEASSGAIDFTLLTNGFEFAKALMQEKFNNHVIESDKFPAAVFKGSITNNATVNYAKPGEYLINVGGDFELHGVTNHMENIKGKLTVQSGGIAAAVELEIHLSDYKIDSPIGNDVIRITVDCKLAPGSN